MKFCTLTLACLALASSSAAKPLKGSTVETEGKEKNLRRLGKEDKKEKKGKDKGMDKGGKKGGKKGVCDGKFEFNEGVGQLLYNAAYTTARETAEILMDGGLSIGSTTALIPEAADASVTGATVADGMSGDTNFPHGNLKPVATVGEFSVCDGTMGEMVVGVPDGLGAYLYNDDTVRLVVQSESYGPITDGESYPFPVNDGASDFTGSHVQYVDVDRYKMADFMKDNDPASYMVTGFGEVIKYAYNLKGQPIGPRTADGPTTYGAHYGNTDAEGNWALENLPEFANWHMQSLCSAHLEERHQWGHLIGVEDTMFLTNEEWINYETDAEAFVGIGAHAIDLATSTSYAVGALTQGGFEKIVEINSKSTDYVILATAGYNGAFSNYDKTLERKNAMGTRRDGKPYIWTRYVVPPRIYIGRKYRDEHGNHADDFLSRNGLRYGQMYGFAVPEGIEDRDPYHKTATNGDMVNGKFLPIPWRWDGEVKNFEYDGSWEFQDIPKFPDGKQFDGYKFWNPNGNDASGCKMEHNTPDPRMDKSGFIQGSTCGYFGHFYLTDIEQELVNAGPAHFPESVMSDYYVYQGETSIFDQVELGGKGQYAQGVDARANFDAGDPSSPKLTFEDIDGLEAIEVEGGDLHVIIQEDSGNDFGERMFISSALEHESDGKDLTYYFVAMSGGTKNTRSLGGVGIPAGTFASPASNEFSGVFDLSGLLKKHDYDDYFVLGADEPGWRKRYADRMVAANDKTILLALQSAQMRAGLVDTFHADRGGQWLVYQPDL